MKVECTVQHWYMRRLNIMRFEAHIAVNNKITYHLSEWDAVYSGKHDPVFWRNLLPSSSTALTPKMKTTASSEMGVPIYIPVGGSVDQKLCFIRMLRVKVFAFEVYSVIIMIITDA